MTEYTLEDLINGRVKEELNTKLYSGSKVAKLLGISKSGLSKRLKSQKYKSIRPLRISNILIFTQQDFHNLLMD